MKWYIYKIPRKNKQFGGHEICRSKEKVIFSDLFPSMQKAIEIIEDMIIFQMESTWDGFRLNSIAHRALAPLKAGFAPLIGFQIYCGYR